MSFELRREETFADNVVRIAQERLDRVLGVLTAEGGCGVGSAAVHAARRDLKKLRALLRLARAGIAGETFSRENVLLRDAGRALSAARDAQVLVEAFDTLRGDLAGRIAPETFAAIHQQLIDDVQANAVVPESVAAAAETLGRMRERVEGWPLLQPDGWRVPGRGLEGVYRRGRRAMRRAADGEAEADFHEWRKQVKFLAAQVALLRPLRPKKLGKLGKALDHLADRLGQEHDLSVLRTRLMEWVGTRVSPHDLEVIGGVIGARRRALQGEALKFGGVVYERKPTGVGRRFKRDWKAWRAEGAGGRS